jgi:hypothetical protein
MYTEYPDEYYDLVDQMVATGRFGGRPEAAAEVRRLRPDLISPTSHQHRSSQAALPSAAGTSTERELDRLARQQQQRKPHLTFAQAYVEILAANPWLYARYLSERPMPQSTGR